MPVFKVLRILILSVFVSFIPRKDNSKYKLFLFLLKKSKLTWFNGGIVMDSFSFSKFFIINFLFINKFVILQGGNI